MWIFAILLFYQLINSRNLQLLADCWISVKEIISKTAKTWYLAILNLLGCLSIRNTNVWQLILNTSYLDEIEWSTDSSDKKSGFYTPRNDKATSCIPPKHVKGKHYTKIKEIIKHDSDQLVKCIVIKAKSTLVVLFTSLLTNSIFTPSANIALISLWICLRRWI